MEYSITFRRCVLWLRWNQFCQVLAVLALLLFFLAPGRNTSFTMASVDYRQVINEKSMKRYAAYDTNTAQPLSVDKWASIMSSADESVQTDFVQVLRNAPFQAMFFETKGASSSTKDKQFEFVLMDAPNLARFAESNPDPNSFAAHLNCSDGPGCAFKSLGGDATLVAPKVMPEQSVKAYSHLAAFIRGAPTEQQHDFWKLVAKQYKIALLSEDTVWLNTEGTGVAWLHMRLDSRPKYYKYREFAKEK